MKAGWMLILGVVVGGLVMFAWGRHELNRVVAAQQAETNRTNADIAAIQREVERLKSIAPTQSHIMADAATQFGNLWFAAQTKNWTQATYFYNETRGRLQWAVRINPKPKASGSDDVVDLQGIFDGIDKGVLANLKKTIDARDGARFVAMYRQTLEACYSCHKSINRPFLRPMIPHVSPQPTTNHEPGAQWPG